MTLAQFYLFFFDTVEIFFRVFAEFLQFFCHFQIFLQDQIQGSFEFVVIDRPITDICKICLASQVISPGILWSDGDPHPFLYHASQNMNVITFKCNIRNDPFFFEYCF